MKDNYYEKFSEYLRKRKLKLTPERKLILDTVFSLHQHFDIDRLYRKMHKNISMATIYRTLPLFVNSGLVNETFRRQGRASYEHTFGHGHHDHLLCIGCGKVIEFSELRIEELQNIVCRRYRFKPIEHRLGIKGYCHECQKSSYGKKRF